MERDDKQVVVYPAAWRNKGLALAGGCGYCSPTERLFARDYETAKVTVFTFADSFFAISPTISSTCPLPAVFLAKWLNGEQ